MRATETLNAKGHENIVAENKSTIEITKERFLTKRGDCIVAVASNKGFRDFSDEFKRTLRLNGSILTLIIYANGEEERIEASGSPDLTFLHPTDLVIRQSSYTCDRTLAIKANKAAKDLSRKLARKLKSSQQRVNIVLVAEHTP